MRYLSVCSGIGTDALAFHPLGWETAAFSEIEPFPSAVLQHHFPDTPNLGDFTQIGEEHGPIDLLCGGTPCFVKGTTVLTKEGLVDIAEIQVGDEVLTHHLRFQPVTAVMRREAYTVRLKGQGHVGLVTTPEHPFYAKTTKRTWLPIPRNFRRDFSEPSWVDAKDMQGKYWASPCSFPELPIPEITKEGHERKTYELTSAFFWFVGLWLGDGWLRRGQRPDRPDGQNWGVVFLCSARKDKGDTAFKLQQAGLCFTTTDEGTTTRFSIYSGALARWLEENFGHYAYGKRLPSWVLGMDKARREALLSGYVMADGCAIENGLQLTSINHTLLLGTKLLAQTLGYSATITGWSGRGKTIIEGREVSERGHYILRLFRNPRSSFESEAYRFGLVRSVTPTGRKETVYNIEVGQDNSYVADGITVHNCQSFSVAGKRLGLDDPRGNLAIEFLRLAQRVRARWLLWENVPGVLSSSDGRDFHAFLSLVGECGYGWSYRVCDAQFFGVPQRRRRVFVIGYFGDWRPTAAVLLDPFSLSRHPAPRRKAGQGTARGIEIGPSGGRTTDISPTLDSRAKDGPIRNQLAPAVLTEMVGATASGLRDVSTSLSTSQQRIDAETETLVVAYPVRLSANRWLADGSDNIIPDTAPLYYSHDYNQDRIYGPDGVVPAHTANDSNRSRNVLTSQVRRLTPRECEALQGLPRDWTLIPYKGKPAADGPRYKAIGNGWALPVAAWVGNRIDMVDKLMAQLLQV